MECTLCGSVKLHKLPSVAKLEKTYYSCGDCELIFVDPTQRLSREDEKNQYLVNANTLDEEAHIAVLNQIIEPALAYINEDMKGLDYGCGPDPLLSKLLEKKSLRCYNYDPLFDFGHPEEIYDYIFATECLENFFVPAVDLKRMDDMLKSGGYLFITTSQSPSIEKFEDWNYRHDPTHVSFYNLETFNYIAKKLKYHLVYNDGERCVIFQKD